MGISFTQNHEFGQCPKIVFFAQKKRGRKCKTFSTSVQWAHLDLNQGPAGYESDALTD